ncbi:hypothetical protein M8J76_007037 [Diaphorina citri]|nr:hypothetical protein M8J76_007037 [Diaphorina citri]
MNLKMKKITSTAIRRIQLHLEDLKSPRILSTYIEEMEREIMQPVQDEVQTDVNQNWNLLKESIRNVANKTLKKRKRKNKIWFNEECSRKVEERAQARLAWLNNRENNELKENYYRTRKETQKLLKQKKREHFNNILTEAQDDFQNHRSRQLHQKVKKATNNYKKRELFVKDKQGNILTNENDISKRWMEYFAELLKANEPEGELEYNFPDTVENEQPIPTAEEIEEIIAKLKNNKASGEDEIYAELFKNGGQELIPTKLISLISDCLDKTLCKIKMPNTNSDEFEVTSGLRQGDPISPILFNLMLERVDRECLKHNHRGLKMGEKSITRMAYADDVILMAGSKAEVAEMVWNYYNIAKKVGLIISEEKTKYMCVDKRDRSTEPLTIHHLSFEKVEEFKYLGSLFNSENRIAQEHQARTAAANRAYFSIQNILKKRSLSTNFKIRLYQCYIVPVLLYGSEALTFRKADEEKLLIFERKILRRIFGPVLDPQYHEWRILKNRELEEKYPHADIIEVMKRRRLNWAGHVVRMKETQIARIAFEENVDGYRLRGRPRSRWKDNIRKDVELMGINPEEWKQVALERGEWAAAVTQAYGR